MNKKYSGGFTLLEVLVSTAVVATLLSIVIMTFQTSKIKAQGVKLDGDFNQINKAVEIFRNKPLIQMTLTSARTNCKNISNIHLIQDGNACMDDLKKIFVDNLGFGSVPRDPWGNPYIITENERNPDCSEYDRLISPGADRETGPDLSAEGIVCDFLFFTCPSLTGTGENDNICK
ncbi:prepilin-type N-terminal cleavage/methylation domain-containing protein [Patescibacteria group bacterium]